MAQDPVLTACAVLSAIGNEPYFTLSSLTASILGLVLILLLFCFFGFIVLLSLVLEGSGCGVWSGVCGA